VRVTGGGFKANPLQLPPGKRHVDEFFGEVETYRQHLAAVLTGAAADGERSLSLEVKYQGCADLGICYPPQTRTLTVALPADDAATAPGATDPAFAALGQSLAGSAGAGAGPQLGTDAQGRAQALPLPPEQAFGFEAIADGGRGLLLRFTPARGYYLYRDRSGFRIEGDDAVAAGSPRWPPGTPHRDEHFGEVVVYFDQVDVPLPLRRSAPEATSVRLVASFQGCQDEGICYPPMTRTVEVALPELQGAQAAPATGSEAPAETGSDTGSDPDRGAEPTPGAASAAADAADPPRDDSAGAGAPPTPAVARVPPRDASADNAARTRPPGAALPAGGAFGALLLALLGGLVLNLMPCVLPILSLKVLGLAQSGASRAHARRHALWYTAGVLVS